MLRRSKSHSRRTNDFSVSSRVSLAEAELRRFVYARAMMLRADDDTLTGLDRGTPALVDATSGRSIGLRVVSRLGRGGMSTVFLAERDARDTSNDLSPETPTHVAVKLVQPATMRQLARIGLDPND